MYQYIYYLLSHVDGKSVQLVSNEVSSCSFESLPQVPSVMGELLLVHPLHGEKGGETPLEYSTSVCACNKAGVNNSNVTKAREQ